MLPKYSKYEIQDMIRDKVEETEGINNSLTEELLSTDSFWTSKHYQNAAEILEMKPEELVEMLPDEPLESVSFRAVENTEEINEVVEDVNDIFELLAYQLKIGKSL